MPLITWLRLAATGYEARLVAERLSPVQGEADGLVSLIATLADDANWRVRHATLLLLPTLAALLPVERFSTAFVAAPSGAFEQRATDACALIRLDWVRICAEIAKLPAYSATWLAADVLPVLRARHAETRHYQRRAVLLEGLAILAPHCAAPMLDELVPLALSMASDKVLLLLSASGWS